MKWWTFPCVAAAAVKTGKVLAVVLPSMQQASKPEQPPTRTPNQSFYCSISVSLPLSDIIPSSQFPQLKYCESAPAGCVILSPRLLVLTSFPLQFPASPWLQLRAPGWHGGVDNEEKHHVKINAGASAGETVTKIHELSNFRLSSPLRMCSGFMRLGFYRFFGKQISFFFLCFCVQMMGKQVPLL